MTFAKRPFTGSGVSTDIIEAAVMAYLNAANKYLALLGEGGPPEDEEGELLKGI